MDGGFLSIWNERGISRCSRNFDWMGTAADFHDHDSNLIRGVDWRMETGFTSGHHISRNRIDSIGHRNGMFYME